MTRLRGTLALVLLSCVASASAEESKNSRAWMAYKNLESVNERIVEDGVRKMTEVARREGRTITPKHLSAARYFVSAMAYQRSIDTMVCLEAAEGGSCLEDRMAKSNEMLKFLSEYGMLDELVTARCLAISRLLNFELKYPPYDFMKKGTTERPQAHDAGAFLSCIRSRL